MPNDLCEPAPAPAAPPPASLPARRGWRQLATGPLGAALVLAAFWVFLVASVEEKSLTSDEIVHATAGYTYWTLRDYRLNPENGILPQRVMALPLLFGGYRAPSTAREAWRNSDEWAVGDEWFHQLGNDLPGMLRRGRAAIGLLTVALGALVWHWSRRLFGPLAGLLSLLLFVASPTILANGALMTSDAACSLFFLAATMSLWATLHHITVGRVLLSGLLMGGLFASKMSAVLMLPIGLVLIVARLVLARPLWLGFGLGRHLTSRPRQAAALGAVVFAHALLVPAVIWGCYGFRYEAFAPGTTSQDRWQHPWEYVLGGPAVSVVGSPLAAGRSGASADPTRKQLAARAFEFLRERQLLPEAYLYGYAHAWRFARARSAFFNGDYGVSGWRTFFPYTFLVKTPLPVFGILALALVAAARNFRRLAAYETLPLWTLLACYWAAAISSRLNIGHRHIMATYAPLFVLGGFAVWWWQAARSRRASIVLAALAALLVVDVGARYPNYLAYFNGLVTPTNAYRHLVDSSLDWGQDLPGLKRFLERQPPRGPVYLSYFGTASPAYYGIRANYLYSAAGLDQPRSPVRVLHTTPRDRAADLDAAQRAWPGCELVAETAMSDGTVRIAFLQNPVVPALGGGTYAISATMLPAIWFGLDGPLGPWNERFETTYQELRRAIAPLQAADRAARIAAFAGRPPEAWSALFERFAQFRFARLTAFLRQREPAHQIGYSILVYPLTDADVAAALNGPPAELGVDVTPRLIAQATQ